MAGGILMKIFVAAVLFLFFFSASVAAQAPIALWPKPPEPSKTTPDMETKMANEVTRLRRENAELKKLVEQLQNKVELLEQSTKVSK
jgi:hypothetical protein